MTSTGLVMVRVIARASAHYCFWLCARGPRHQTMITSVTANVFRNEVYDLNVHVMPLCRNHAASISSRSSAEA
jgi:hypothetical protein